MRPLRKEYSIKRIMWLECFRISGFSLNLRHELKISILVFMCYLSQFPCQYGVSITISSFTHHCIHCCLLWWIHLKPKHFLKKSIRSFGYINQTLLEILSKESVLYCFITSYLPPNNVKKTIIAYLTKSLFLLFILIIKLQYI